MADITVTFTAPTVAAGTAAITDYLESLNYPGLGGMDLAQKQAAFKAKLLDHVTERVRNQRKARRLADQAGDDPGLS